ncbi:MAG: PIN domain-containing protein [Gloeobacteraceae cyanobacterium ES-bin-144]|nr:PIN domain-containing protein [Verrucomicrobiales bacterium]
MARSDVMVDANVYIDLLKSRQDAVDVLYRWADDRNLALCGMIRLEVLRGVKSLKLLTKLSAFMDLMINVPSDNRLWSEATDLAWNLDRKGIVIPGADAVIAASALRLGAVVMTSDAHFSRIEGLRVIAPPPEWFGI